MGVGYCTARAVVLAALAASAMATPVGAQAPPPIGTPVAIDPNGCLAPPRPIAEIVALVGTTTPSADESPSFTASGPAATPSSPAPAEGKPADAATTAAVAATIVEVAACSEAGEFASVYALATDGFVRRTVGPLTEEALAVLEGVGFPNAAEGTPPVLTVTEVWLLEDRRAVALVLVEDGELDQGAPRLRRFELRLEGERWLLDAVADVADAGTPTR